MDLENENAPSENLLARAVPEDDTARIYRTVRDGFSSAVYRACVGEPADLADMHNWVAAAVSTGMEQRWVSLRTALTSLVRVHQVLNGGAPRAFSEVRIQQVIAVTVGQDPDADACEGVRDALYAATSYVGDGTENYEADWMWYASEECPPLRYMSFLLTVIYLITWQMHRWEKGSEYTAAQLWGGLFPLL
jgi:hypothetical protein